MIKRIVKMSFETTKVEAFKAIYKANWQKISSFEGCKHVELLQDQFNPNVFFTFSIWQNEADLNAYRNSELFATVWSSVKALFNDKPLAWTVKEISF
jgi:quinol monooxygenase YgiN